MTRKLTLPAGPLLAEVERRGGLEELLYTMEEGDGAHPEFASWDSRLDRARVEGEVSLPIADLIAVDLLGVHPSLVYGGAYWDLPLELELDYDDLEESLLAGQVESKSAFWGLVSEAMDREPTRRERDAVRAALMPEAREILGALPNMTLKEVA